MKISLICTDLDNTLFDRDGNASPRTEAAIRECARRGILFVPVTGRQYEVGRWIRENPYIPYYIHSNGARCVNNRTGEAVFFSGLPADSARATLELMRDVPCCRRILADRKIISDSDYLLYAERPETDPDLFGYCDIPGAEIEKIDTNFKDLDCRALVWERVEKLPGVSVSAAWPYNIEINGPDGDKGAGILHLARMFGIPREEVMAFGDGSNDAPMLRAAGIGVAMDNAVPAAKAAADLMAPANWEDGEAQVIEALAFGAENEFSAGLKR